MRQFAAAGFISGKINGQEGTNTIDFSAQTAPVTVNLLTGTSTYPGGVSKIQNATGGSGADVLIGDGQANNLQGNGGGDILVGNGGNDTLNGGGDRDLLVGGLGSDTLDGRGEDDLESIAHLGRSRDHRVVEVLQPWRKGIGRDQCERNSLDEPPVLPQSQERFVQAIVFLRERARFLQLGRQLGGELTQHRVVEEHRFLRAGGAIERVVKGLSSVPPVLQKP